MDLCLYKKLKWSNTKPVYYFFLFAALHAMQMWFSDDNCPSVHPSNACIVTKQKKDLSRFLYHTKDHLA